MGYTHYWTIFQNEIPQDIWRSFASDFIKILPQFMDKLDHETDQKFDITGNHIIFNGIGEQGHETFSMNTKNKMEESHTGNIEYFDFCKTARKEYDIAVCCALIIAKKHFADIIRVSSDGSEEDGWDKAKELCQKVLKYGKSFDIELGEI
jgi:hypothetical protein